ncbi:PucR family transcriptional regulator [Wukongibacter baidiensis]|uniref:PucR family transcriptional regulator n=1 Tax=Wukongibacter baidiensis TaxID=1723361 RepID=UPI003D7F1FE3
MSITIKEALEMECFKDFKVIAGEKGLSNRVRKVGILDYEIKELIEKNFVEGEFTLTTLLNIKNNIEELYEIVEALISVGVSGLAIKDIYFDNIPDEVIKLANRNSFPIFMFSAAYFEDIITNVVEAIKGKNENEVLVLKIDNILYSDLNNMMIKKIAYEINRDFRDRNIIVFCKRNSNKNTISPMIDYDNILDQFNKVIPYKEGHLIINTFEDIDNNEVNEVILRRLEILGFSTKEYSIGISSLHNRLDELNYSIKESLYAFQHGITYNREVSFFNNIGTSKILLPLIDNPWVQRYYDEMVTPLLIYDKRNDTELLKTAIIYIENNGDIKATAKDLFQHSNTIRYRIDRIGKILNNSFESKHFYEELAIAIRVHNLMNRVL